MITIKKAGLTVVYMATITAVITLIIYMQSLAADKVRQQEAMTSLRLPLIHASDDDIVMSFHPSSYPADPLADIPWSCGYAGVESIQCAFNQARSAENAQLGSSLPPLIFPQQTVWDSLSDGKKGLWIINRERIDRGLAPLEDTERNVTGVAEAYANFLLDNDAWGHYEDGRSPWERLKDNGIIGACHDPLSVAENIAVLVSTGGIAMPVERSVYMWMYNDAGSGWGHRHAILWFPYQDNSGLSGMEGFLGIGRASGGPYQGPFSKPWPYAELVVMNIFDPCAHWEYDSDGDTIPNNEDNCPTDANEEQTDTDQDTIGNACDNCPDDYNPDQTDTDNDGIGNVCDVGPPLSSSSSTSSAASSTTTSTGVASSIPSSSTSTTAFSITTSTTTPVTTSIAGKCALRIIPSFTRALPLQAISFTIQNSGYCKDADYEWSVYSTVGSTCDQQGNYIAGVNSKPGKAALDIIEVIDHANKNISVNAYVRVLPGCPVMQLYGEQSEEAQLLRKFRDDVLGTTEGSYLVTLYYQWAPLLSAAMEENETFKTELKKLIDTLLPLIRAQSIDTAS